MISNINIYLKKSTESSKLAVFRICFGLLMLYSMVRFWSKNWIHTIYVEPKFHFKYYGFEWIQSLGTYTYVLFIICIICSILITLGLWYRLSIIVFFLSFTYIELIEKTTYLNHYYFVSLLSFILIFLPASSCFSIDSILKKKQYSQVPKWTTDSIKLLMIIVYFYAGLAKINSDWLLEALPLKIWMPSKYDIPLIGETFLQYEWVHYLMSWGGMLYDLTIPFLLLNKRTRMIGFFLVLFFHLFTAILFPIGMFPYIMILSALVFFDGQTHDKIIKLLKRPISVFMKKSKVVIVEKLSTFEYKRPKLILITLAIFFLVQIVVPFRYVLYPSELFWSEEGYRFSWRVMLVEKIGYTTFKIKNKDTGVIFEAPCTNMLTKVQTKQMSFQADMILEFAHYLGDYYKKQGLHNIAVFANSYVTLNGRPKEQFIDPSIDLLSIEESFKHKVWIKPYKYDIKGF